MENDFNKFIAEKLAAIVTDVNDGAENPLRAFAILRQIKNDAESAIAEIEDYAMTEAKKYDKTFQMEGYEFTWKEGSRKFDYKGCKTWVEKNRELKEIEDRLKAAYNATNKFGELASTESGDVIEVPAMTFSKSSISVKIINQ